MFENASEYQNELWVHLRAPGIASNKPGSVDNKAGRVDNQLKRIYN
jgi:hypothetical protein